MEFCSISYSLNTDSRINILSERSTVFFFIVDRILFVSFQLAWNEHSMDIENRALKCRKRKASVLKSPAAE